MRTTGLLVFEAQRLLPKLFSWTVIIQFAMASDSSADAAAVPAAVLQRRGHIEEADVRQAMEEDEHALPRVGARIMVVRDPWLQMILSGEKTMEIRGTKCRTGLVWVGSRGFVHGSVTITQSIEMTAEEFAARRSEHHWPEGRALPYERLCGLLLTDPKMLQAPIEYGRPPAAIGWNIFRTGPEDMAVKASAPSRKRPASAGPAGENESHKKKGKKEKKKES